MVGQGQVGALDSWQQFLADVRNAREELGNPEPVWYRGHSQVGWSLVPWLFRNPEWADKEQEAFLAFKRSATRLFQKRDSDWEVLFDMQHYGIPTRLLDWSEVLGIALAFVIYSSLTMPGDAAIYLLDPRRLNKRSGLQEIKSLPDDASFNYKEIYWYKKPFAPRFPVAIYPPLQSERLFAQRGVFTIHGDVQKPIELQCPDAVRKVILPITSRKSALEFLEYSNLDEYAIYPDIVGMARHLKRHIFGDQ